MKKNNIIIGLAGLLILSIVIISITGATPTTKQSSITGNTIQQNGDVRQVTVTFENYEYQFSDTLIKGVPTELVIDLNTVTGCMRDIVISAFNVRKYVQQGDNIIRFTPDKAGTFNIACSMNMGRGTFTVVEQDGSTSTFKEETTTVAGGSCGAGTGGCGCGAGV